MKILVKKVFLLSAAIIILSSGPIFAEDINLDRYYAFPVSAGFYYQQMSGIGNKALSDFEINQISAEARIPLPDNPYLQPLLRSGYADFTFTGSIDFLNQDWSHKHLFFGPGFAYCTRISREFEIGADIFTALSQTYFTELNLNGEQQTFGQLNLFSGLSGRLALNPSYNFSISLNPTFNYIRSFGALHTYDGFSFGVGFSASYRFGTDPDSAGSGIRAIRFSDVKLESLYSAMQSYYVKNPAGTFTITNTDKRVIENLDIYFMQQGFMDTPSPVANKITLQPGESVKLPFLISFNNAVFTTEGVTPLTGEIIAAYTIRGREVEQRESVNYDLYDSNSIIWDDNRKAAAFITSQDSAVRNYAGYINRIHKEDLNRNFSRSFQFALQAYNALGELGIVYQADPASPFASVSGNSMSVDTINLPRETLARLSGDCDDLAVLYATLLESAGISTALVTVPGHIFCAFNTEIPSSNYSIISPDRTNIIDYNGEIWLPVEITMIGRNDFFSAWKTGGKEFSDFDDDSGNRGFYPTSEAQKIFRPVALRETDLGLQYGSSTELTSQFRRDLSSFTDKTLQTLKQETLEKNTARSWNMYGIAAAKLSAFSTAETAFNQAVKLKNDYTNAKLNLGSLYYLLNRYSSALSVFKSMEDSSADLKLSERTMFSLYLNLSRTSYAMDKPLEAREYYDKAEKIDPQKAVNFSYLGGSNETSRAAEMDSGIIFF